MANELLHIPTAAGTTLKRSDWEDVDIHRFQGQATGDLMYASSNTQLRRLAMADNKILVSSGSLPTWSNILPAYSLGGTVTLGGQAFDAGAGLLHIDTTGKHGLEVDGGMAVGVSVLGYTQNYFAGDFTSDGSADIAYKMSVGGYIIGYAGDTARLAILDLEGRVTTQTATEDIGIIAQLYVREPRISDNLTGNITVAASIYVLNAPSEGLTNAAIYVAAGDLKFAGSLDSALVANQVAMGAFDDGGAMTLAISQENPVVNEILASDRTLPVRINGTTYKILLHT